MSLTFIDFSYTQALSSQFEDNLKMLLKAVGLKHKKNYGITIEIIIGGEESLDSLGIST